MSNDETNPNDEARNRTAADKLIVPHSCFVICRSPIFPEFVGVRCGRSTLLIRNTGGMKRKITGKDLAREAPRSPRIRVGGYAILGRTIDKCRALVAGNIGEYHFDCPLDNTLFGFKGIKGDDFKAQIEQGAGDQEIVEWLNQSGEKKTPEEISRWSEEVEASSLYDIPEKRDFFAEKVKKLGLHPAKTTTFEWLELDDRVSHAQQAA
jgi:hypothetical protein